MINEENNPAHLNSISNIGGDAKYFIKIVNDNAVKLLFNPCKNYV